MNNNNCIHCTVYRAHAHIFAFIKRISLQLQKGEKCITSHGKAVFFFCLCTIFQSNRHVPCVACRWLQL